MRLSMKREMLINATPREPRGAIIEDEQLAELLVDRPDARRMVGDIYYGRVDAVLPGIQAAFVDIGTEKSAFRLRHWSSLRYLRISPLHRKFQSPLQSSSTAVSNAVSELSSKISHPTYRAAYAPFTPNESEQRLRPLYYRGCWHRVSRLFLFGYYQRSRS